jgi:hypothetical protein
VSERTFVIRFRAVVFVTDVFRAVAVFDNQSNLVGEIVAAAAASIALLKKTRWTHQQE